MPGDITYAVRCYVAGKECDTYIVTPLPSATTLFHTLAQVDAEDQWFDTVKLIEREELAPRSSDTSRVRYHNGVIAYWSSQEGTDGDEGNRYFVGHIQWVRRREVWSWCAGGHQRVDQ